MEPEESFHRLERSRSHGKRHRGSQGSRPETKSTGAVVRHCVYLGAQTRAAHARSGAGRNGPDRPSDQKNLALNERDYGDLSGLNKDDARKKWGERQVHVWRRSYDVPPPGGESLKDTLARTLPY